MSQPLALSNKTTTDLNESRGNFLNDNQFYDIGLSFLSITYNSYYFIFTKHRNYSSVTTT